MPTMLRHATPVARKPHRCLTCGLSIAPGEKYDRAVYLGDDGLYEWVCCSPCADLTNVVWDWAGKPWERILDSDWLARRDAQMQAKAWDEAHAECCPWMQRGATVCGHHRNPYSADRLDPRDDRGGE